MLGVTCTCSCVTVSFQALHLLVSSVLPFISLLEEPPDLRVPYSLRPVFAHEDSTVGVTSLFRCHLIPAVNREAARGRATIRQHTHLQEKRSLFQLESSDSPEHQYRNREV